MEGSMPEILRDYFENTVKPAVDEYLSGNGRFNIRKARLAAIVVEHIIDYYSLAYKKDRAEVRKDITDLLPLYSVTRDAADATKHGSLKRRNTDIKENGQIKCPPGFFQAPFGEGCWAEAIEVYAETDDGRKISLENAIKEVMRVWDMKISPR